MSFDALIKDMAGLAVGLVSDTDLTYTQITPGAYNPTTGEAAPISTVYSVRATKGTPAPGLNFVGGELVRAGDISLMFAAPWWTPAPGDRVSILGDTYAVAGVRSTWGGDVPVMYELLVRR